MSEPQDEAVRGNHPAHGLRADVLWFLAAALIVLAASTIATIAAVHYTSPPVTVVRQSSCQVT